MRGLGKVNQGRVSPRVNKAEIKKYDLSSKVTFQEILLIRICLMNVQDKWELGNI